MNKKLKRMDTVLYNTFMPTPRKTTRSLCKDVARNLDMSSPEENWICFKNVISGESFKSYGINKDIKRFSILYKQLGFQPGDCLYAMTGDSNYIYAASLAVWRLGGFVALGWSDKIDLIAAQLNETKPSIILVDSTHGEVVLEAIRHSTHATFNSRVLSIGYLNDHCHNVLNLIRNIDVNFVPEITQPVDPLLVHWSKDSKRNKNNKAHQLEMIRHDTMKELLAQALRENESDTTNIVSTIQPSRVDGFLDGLNILLYGRGGYYQLLQRSLSIETLLMVISDTQPKVLHLKPEHYQLLSDHNIAFDSGGNKDFSSVECIIVHGNCNLPRINKERLDTMFPNLQAHTFLEGEYYEVYESKSHKNADKQRHVNFKRRDSDSSTSSDASTTSRKSSCSSSSSSSNDEFLSVDSST